MMKVKQFILILILIICIPALGGCSAGRSIYSNYKEIAQLQIVETVAVDKSEDMVTASVSSTYGTGEEPPLLVSCEGESINEAFERVQAYTPREYLFYSHVNNVILGEELAADGLDGVLDYIERSPQLRIATDLYVLKGSRGKDAMGQSYEERYDISAVLPSIQKDVAMHAEGYVYNCGDISRSLSESGSALICSIELESPEGSILGEHPDYVIQPYGYAVLKEGKLIGYLSGDDARGVGLLTDKFNGSSMNITSDAGERVTLKFIESSREIEPKWEKDNSVSELTFKIDVQCGIVDVDNVKDINRQDFRDEISKKASLEMENWVKRVLDFSVDNSSDFLELGRYLEIKSPKKFARMPKSWPEPLGEINCNIQINTDISRSFDLENHINFEGGGKGSVKNR